MRFPVALSNLAHTGFLRYLLNIRQFSPALSYTRSFIRSLSIHEFWASRWTMVAGRLMNEPTRRWAHFTTSTPKPEISDITFLVGLYASSLLEVGQFSANSLLLCALVSRRQAVMLLMMILRSYWCIVCGNGGFGAQSPSIRFVNFVCWGHFWCTQFKNGAPL